MQERFEQLFAETEDPIAYIRPVEEDEGRSYLISDADGYPLGMSPTRPLAFAAARQHGLTPVDAH